MDSKTFEKALRKALLGPHLEALEAPKSPSLVQLLQGPLGVAGGPHGSPQGQWGRTFGTMTPQGLSKAIQDEMIDRLKIG